MNPEPPPWPALATQHVNIDYRRSNPIHYRGDRFGIGIQQLIVRLA